MVRGIVIVAVAMSAGGSALAADSDIDAFNQSLSAARARNGYAFVNGEYNVLVDAQKVIAAQSEDPKFDPFIRIDSPLVRTVNVNVVANSQITVFRPAEGSRVVELFPVVRDGRQNSINAPLGAVILSNGVTPQAINTWFNLQGVSVRPK